MSGAARGNLEWHRCSLGFVLELAIGVSTGRGLPLWSNHGGPVGSRVPPLAAPH